LKKTIFVTLESTQLMHFRLHGSYKGYKTHDIGLVT